MTQQEIDRARAEFEVLWDKWDDTLSSTPGLDHRKIMLVKQACWESYKAALDSPLVREKGERISFLEGALEVAQRALAQVEGFDIAKFTINAALAHPDAQTGEGK